MTDIQAYSSYSIIYNYLRQLWTLEYKEIFINNYRLIIMGDKIFISDMNFSFSIMIKKDKMFDPDSIPTISWIFNKSGKNLSSGRIIRYIVREIKLMEILG